MPVARQLKFMYQALVVKDNRLSEKSGDIPGNNTLHACMAVLNINRQTWQGKVISLRLYHVYEDGETSKAAVVDYGASPYTIDNEAIVVYAGRDQKKIVADEERHEPLDYDAGTYHRATGYPNHPPPSSWNSADKYFYEDDITWGVKKFYEFTHPKIKHKEN